MSKKGVGFVMIISIILAVSLVFLVVFPDDWFVALTGKSTLGGVFVEDISPVSGSSTTAISVLLQVETKNNGRCIYTKESEETINLEWKDFANTGEKEHSTPVYLDVGKNSYEIRCYKLNSERYQKRNWYITRKEVPVIKCKEYLETGKNYFEYGYVEEETLTVSNFYYDQCTNRTKSDNNDLLEIMEYYCDNGEVKFEYYECPDLCRSGACQTPPKA